MQKHLSDSTFPQMFSRLPTPGNIVAETKCASQPRFLFGKRCFFACPSRRNIVAETVEIFDVSSNVFLFAHPRNIVAEAKSASRETEMFPSEFRKAFCLQTQFPFRKQFFFVAQDLTANKALYKPSNPASECFS